MLLALLELLNKLLGFFPDQDGTQRFSNASDESLQKLAESHIDKKVWKNLKQAERQKIKYFRQKARTDNKMARLMKRAKKKIK